MTPSHPTTREAGILNPAASTVDQPSVDGFSGAGTGRAATGGIAALIDPPMISYERIPALEAIVERLVRLLRTSSRKLSADMVEVRLDRITSSRFGQYVETMTLPSLIGVMKSRLWDGFGLITAPSSLANALTDVLFGGTAALQPPDTSGRAFSSIETKMLRQFMEMVIGDLNEAFTAVAPIDFAIERVETNPRFAMITQPHEAVVLATMTIAIGSLEGFFDLVLPYTALEPIRPTLDSTFVNDDRHEDVWRRHLVEHVCKSEAELTAVLFEKEMPLREVMDLAVGETLMLDLPPQAPVLLRCGSVPLARGQMGHVSGHIALQLTEKVEAEAHRGSDQRSVEFLMAQADTRGAAS